MTKELKGLLEQSIYLCGSLEVDLIEKSGFDDLSRKQVACLRLINELGNPSLSELAVKLKITRPSVTTMIDKLRTRDYVLRVKSDADRRSAHVHLTSKGMKAARMQSHLHQRIALEIMERLDPSERESLFNILTKIEATIKKYGS